MRERCIIANWEICKPRVAHEPENRREVSERGLGGKTEGDKES